MRTFCFIFFLLLLTPFVNSQTTIKWFPSGLNVQPFTANFLEPRAGFSYILGKNEIRLDIGTTTDIFLHKHQNKSFSLGADLFTYTRLRGENDFKFPVETIDYLFGVNAGCKITNADKEIGFRVRLSHISAHLVDGSFDSQKMFWRDNKSPRTYSREFVEFFPYYKFAGLRIYLGLTYLAHINPPAFGRWIYQGGFDYYADGLISDFITPFAAYDFKLAKVSKYSGNNILETGFKFGKYNSKGISIIFSYYSGKSVHGEYFNINEKYTTFGINVDL
jgi:Protein of unknown function (DUF1207)